MYRIAVLSENADTGQRLAGWTNAFCEEKGIFPVIEQYEDYEAFFAQIKYGKPSSVILALPGVLGLNVAEHLRSLLPDCGFIWLSDLDFSLHAYKLRAEYFMLQPVSEETMREGLSAWLEIRKFGK